MKITHSWKDYINAQKNVRVKNGAQENSRKQVHIYLPSSNPCCLKLVTKLNISKSNLDLMRYKTVYS